MKLDLLVSQDRSIKVNIDNRNDHMFPIFPEILKVYEQVKDIEGFRGIRHTIYEHKSDILNKYIIGNNKINIKWNSDYDFESLKLDLRLLDNNDRKHNSIVMRHFSRKYGYKPLQLEVFNLYDFIIQMLTTGYERGTVIELKDYRHQLKDLYLAINNNSIALLTRNYDTCIIANSERMEISQDEN